VKAIVTRLALALPLALLLVLSAHATDYRVLPASRLGFSGVFQGSTFEGSFTRWTAQIRYDPAQLATSRFDVTVDAASVHTGDDDRDQALPGTAFFDVARFPTAHFVSTGFRQVAGKVRVDGQLTLRGVTRPISLDLTFAPTTQGATLDASGTLNRLDYGVGGGEYADTSVIGAPVQVHAHLLLAK
jgi:polyisoprenoid-binding protein YceI